MFTLHRHWPSKLRYFGTFHYGLSHYNFRPVLGAVSDVKQAVARNLITTRLHFVRCVHTEFNGKSILLEPELAWRTCNGHKCLLPPAKCGHLSFKSIKFIRVLICDWRCSTPTRFHPRVLYRPSNCSAKTFKTNGVASERTPWLGNGRQRFAPEH